jgi:selenocysteine lyase/cysteine desulfurase
MKKGRKVLATVLVLGLIIGLFAACKSGAGTSSGEITLDNVRDYVVGIDEEMQLESGGKKVVTNFDNAATTPALQPVMDAVDEELKKYGSIGRGFSPKSNHSTEIYYSTREKVIDFVGADHGKYTVFYVNNTTDGLNKLASALIEDKSDTVLATRIEHHSNDLPWRENATVIYAEVDDQGRVIYDEIEKQLKNNKVKYVAVTAASNVTGYVTDVHRVAKLAHQYGAKIIVDGAQIVAHRKFTMCTDDPSENIDFFVFSAHKMYSPYGGGAVVGLTEVMEKHMPKFYGGGTIQIVGDDWVDYAQPPKSYEAGSPNYPGVVGMGKAIEILEGIGFDKIEEHEKILNQKLVDGLLKMDNVIVYGDTKDLSDRVGVVTFNFSDINSQLVAEALSDHYAVATRRGAFCANPYVWRLYGLTDEEVHNFEECSDMNTPGMIRVSFGIYNTEEEVDYLLEVLPKAIKEAKNTDGAKLGLADPRY